MNNHHHRLIRKLVALARQLRAEAAELRDQVDSVEERAQHYENLAERRASSVREAEREAQREREDREYQDYRRHEALQKLLRAQDCRDQWSERRALQELREI